VYCTRRITSRSSNGRFTEEQPRFLHANWNYADPRQLAAFFERRVRNGPFYFISTSVVGLPLRVSVNE